MITGTLTLTEVVCCKCGIHFAMDTNFYQNCMDDDNKTFYCPNGHPQHFTVNEIDKLKKENKALNDSLYFKDQELQKVKVEKANAKRRLTITQKRIANGICPCCNRSFQNVARHMTSKHPDFKEVVS
jgi:hypothetical protein